MLQFSGVVKLLVLLLCFLSVKDVDSSHFRGAIISVRPHQGGASKEVSIATYTYRCSAGIWLPT